ncbi:MAG: hypothetical protein IJ605_00370 [Prevotella sp.]|nr:hypothetical protein [Prevotella sp.]
MEKKQYYFAPAVRVRPFGMAGDILEDGVITTSPTKEMDENEAFGKETVTDEDLNGATYQPYSSIWED